MDQPKDGPADATDCKADNSGTDSPKPKRPIRHTIASLRLNVAQVEKNDKFWELLPRDIYNTEDAWKTYPLPTDLQELFRVSLLQYSSRVRSNPSGLYIKRAREHYKRRNAARTVGRHAIEAQQHATRQVAYRARKEINAEKADLRALVDGVKLEVAKAMASLTDLYGLAKTGNAMIMRAFVDNKPVHEAVPVHALDGGMHEPEYVSIQDFQRSSQSILNHTAKIGLPTGDDKPAEDAIFREYQASIDATRGGIDATEAKDPDEPEKTH